MIFELWHSEEDNSYSFFPKDANYERNRAFDLRFTPDIKLIWTYNARSYYEAMQARNDFLGWGKYKPEPDWKDIFFDE